MDPHHHPVQPKERSHVQLPQPPPGLEALLQGQPGWRLTRRGDALEIECGDVKGALLRLIALLNEHRAELASLETQEPSLERVFLHLTGRALRD